MSSMVALDNNLVGTRPSSSSFIYRGLLGALRLRISLGGLRAESGGALSPNRSLPMSRRALGLVLLALGATASHWPRGGRWVSVRGGAQDASSSASKKRSTEAVRERGARRRSGRRASSSPGARSSSARGAAARTSSGSSGRHDQSAPRHRAPVRDSRCARRRSRRGGGREARAGRSRPTWRRPGEGAAQRIVKEVRAAHARNPSLFARS